MRIDEIEARMAQIKDELQAPESDLDALQEEIRSLNAEKAQLREQAKADEETRRRIAEGLGKAKKNTRRKPP